MSNGTSQGLFMVVAIVIFGVFVALSYTVFGSDGLSGGIENITSQAIDSTRNISNKLVYSSNMEVDRFSSPYHATREFIWYGVNLSSIFDEHGVGEYVIEFEVKADITGTVAYYMQNGSNSEYSWGRPYVQVTTDYQKFSRTVNVRHTSPELSQSQLAFYGGYNTGTYPTVRNVRLYKVR